MNREREELVRLEELFHLLKDIPAADRPRQAELLAAGDTPLGDRALRLVAAFENTQRSRPAGDARPLQFGPYRVIGVLGTGGMGTVYLAERADGQFEQKVALKVIAPYVGGGAFQERFLAERQILAGLNHPNITKLLDGGTTAEGVPYLVMEYVDGQPIDKDCDARRLTVSARLRLFLKVCDAVDYAHRNLIVHRDLKPPNILVTSDGDPKLLDFGTARLHENGSTSAPTMPLMTPRYSSPEQLRAAPAHVSADVYSLGIVLFELLTGAWPFGDPNSEAVLERIRREVSPNALPFAATADAAELRSTNLSALKRQLSGDLASVLPMALEHDPARRYATVREFAADLERYLAGEPVKARRQTCYYRAEKFLRRNLWYAAAGGVVAAAMIGATIISITYGRRAVREAGRARVLSRFTTQTLLAASPGWGSPLNANPGAITLEALLDNAGHRAGQDLASDPAAEAEMRTTLGATWLALGNNAKALKELNQALEKAMQVRDHPFDNETAFLLQMFCNVESARGDYSRARGYCQEALAAIRKAGQPNHDLAFSIPHDLAYMSAKQDAPLEEVEQGYRASADAARRYFATTDVRWSIAMTRVALCRYDAGDLREAGAILQEIVTHLRSLPGPPVDLVPALRGLGVVRRTEGRLREAQALFQEALDLLRKRPTAYFSAPVVELDLALARALDGEATDVAERSRHLLRTVTESLPAGHLDRAWPEVLAGRILSLAHLHGEADLLLRDAASIFQARLRHWPGPRAEALSALAGSFAAEGKAEEAASIGEEALRLYEQAYGTRAASHPAVLSARQLKP